MIYVVQIVVFLAVGFGLIGVGFYDVNPLATVLVAAAAAYGVTRVIDHVRSGRPFIEWPSMKSKEPE